jgi:hypothetical protein
MHDKVLLQSLLAQWSEIKTLQKLLSETDDEELLLAIFDECEKRFGYKGIADQ